MEALADRMWRSIEWQVTEAYVKSRAERPRVKRGWVG